MYTVGTILLHSMVISIERVNVFIAFRTMTDIMVSPEVHRIYIGVNRDIIFSRKKREETMVGKSQKEALNVGIRNAWWC